MAERRLLVTACVVSVIQIGNQSLLRKLLLEETVLLDFTKYCAHSDL